jgi:hypothetical protein
VSSELGIANSFFFLPSFSRKRESIVDAAEVDPRLRGDDEGWMGAKVAGKGRFEASQLRCTSA